MTHSPALPERYSALIDQIVEATLKGKIRSKEQVYRQLKQEIEPGTGEVFERCLGDHIIGNQRLIETQTDEIKLAKAERRQRALTTIQGEWRRWQEQNQAMDQRNHLMQALKMTETEDDLLLTLLTALDPNQPEPLGINQWQQLAQQLDQASVTTQQPDLQHLATGLRQGILSWQRLEPHLVSWIYDQAKGQIGFSSATEQGPWAIWAKCSSSPLLVELFQHLAVNLSAVQWASQQTAISLVTWVDLTLALRCLQQGLTAWFDQLVYDSKVGAKLSIATFLTFAALWSQFAQGLQQSRLSDRQQWVDACFQMTLQLLRQFAQRDYFPLYGGIFASFTGTYLQNTLAYLDAPLKQADATQEKARILTLLGSSRRARGDYQTAQAFHQEALQLAESADDRACIVANLNHLSRLHLSLKTYSEAVKASQRALILSRQWGDRRGEANALANLGYSEVLQAQRQEQADTDTYEQAMSYLQQGLQLTERLGDRQSQALCLSSLGIAHVTLEEIQTAIPYLESGWQCAQFSGDLYLQGLNLLYLGEAYHRLEETQKLIQNAALSMYILHQIQVQEWRQAAGLLKIRQGKLGVTSFADYLAKCRPEILKFIGVDGYDAIMPILSEYT